MLTTLVVQVENRPGVLNRVSSLFRRRAFNIESLTVGHTHEPGVSRMTIVVDTDDGGAARLESNLYKLVNVISVQNVSSTPSIRRDFAVIKVATTPDTLAEIMQLAHVFRARVVDVATDSMILETTGAEDKIDGFCEVLRRYGILEMARTGRVAMTRGAQPVTDLAVAAPELATQISVDEEAVSYSV
jgi:acetolactate synthase-1/3 small subunit